MLGFQGSSQFYNQDGLRFAQITIYKSHGILGAKTLGCLPGGLRHFSIFLALLGHPDYELNDVILLSG